jgi:hypothetical protein
MKNIKIQTFGRLGNFIIQIKYAIQVALFYNYNVIIPKHNFINTTYLVFNNKVTVNCEKIEDTFFYPSKIPIPNLNLKLFELNIDKSHEILKSIFIFEKQPPLNANDLVIHIRSEDIFSKNPHPYYIPPPLSYYTSIIKNNNFNDIYLITTDKLNPCINELINIFPKIKFKIQSLEEDIKLILRAITIIGSFGSFIPSLMILSNHIQKIYLPSYMNIYSTSPEIETYNISFFNNKILYIDLSKYHKLMGNWKNTAEQNNLILLS